MTDDKIRNKQTRQNGSRTQIPLSPTLFIDKKPTRLQHNNQSSVFGHIIKRN